LVAPAAPAPSVEGEWIRARMRDGDVFLANPVV
jgi:hypothetical protein